MKRFEIGKAYQHTSGQQMFICALADTLLYGICFIAETGYEREKLKQLQEDWDNTTEIKSATRPGSEGWNNLTPISTTEDATANWEEIPVEAFKANNFC